MQVGLGMSTEHLIARRVEKGLRSARRKGCQRKKNRKYDVPVKGINLEVVPILLEAGFSCE